jgi:DNA-binding HxlR family transcriptional regulator
LRFAALRRSIGGVSEKVLTQHLRELEADRIIDRRVVPSVPPLVEYSLSAHGRTLCDIIQGLAAWGAHHRRFLEGGRSTVPG